MVESQREKLHAYPHKYLSIGITADGTPKGSGWVPWENMGNAFNMRIPEIYFLPEDLADETIWAELSRFHIIGCYIFCPLEDYSFLYRLTELDDLRIFHGQGLKDLDFLRHMENWFQLHIEDAVLEDLTALFPDGPRKGIHSYCVCLGGCTVKDISALIHPKIWLSELVILAPEGSNDRERWKAIHCGKYSYFEYRLPEG